MASSDVSSATDVDPRGRRKDATDELADRLKRHRADQEAQSRADLNQQRPVLRRDPVSQQEYYEGGAPVALRRLFGSPMRLEGVYARGPNKEREITGGWGDPRWYNGKETFHKGLDYPGPYANGVGEEIYAVADGFVTFVGYQALTTRVAVDMPRTDSNLNIVDRNGQIVGPRDQVQVGGIYVKIDHVGEFAGYSSLYFHLSSVVDFPKDRNGKIRIYEGNAVGYMGLSGVRNLNQTKPHLHFEIWYKGAKVNPAQLVPNFWPGHLDSTSPGAPRIMSPGPAPGLAQAVFTGSASIVNGFYRSVTLQNQDLVQVRRTMANYALRNAQVAGFGQTALYAAASAANVLPPVVSNPMTFDFTTGEWNDGKAV